MAALADKAHKQGDHAHSTTLIAMHTYFTQATIPSTDTLYVIIREIVRAVLT